ncbi:MAG TPA: ATP synthase F1 subunit gamma [Gemmatimonadales bacterium]|nr:ATP synthase F1 subunit gamma [Gemmatimonadales bacterium]
MAQARELRRRIKSVQSTRQITRTMEMVATSKLKRAQDRVVAARPYANALAEVIGDLYAPDLAERFPLLRQPGAQGVKRVALIGITANRGLCGAFNTNLIREMRRRIAELEGQGVQVELHLIGRKGASFFRFTKRAVASQRTDIGERPTADHAQEIITPVLEQFAKAELDAVEIVFAKFTSAISTPATTVRILPVAPPEPKAGGVKADYLLKPSAEAILEELLPLYVRNQVYRALVETTAGFYGSQRTAMKNATDNAGEMLDLLKRTYNRARQGQITQELAEIVGGAEALNG